MLEAEEHAVQIDRLLAPPVVERELRDEARNRNAGIVDEHVEAPELLSHRFDGGDPVRFRRHVEMNEGGPAGLLADSRCAAFALRVLEIGNDDARTFPGEKLRRRTPYAAACARDECHLAVEFSHLRDPLCAAGSSQQCYRVVFASANSRNAGCVSEFL